MSNDPNKPAGGFGSQQFQKTQFAHKPHQERGGVDPEIAIRQRVGKPATALKIVSILAIIVYFALMAFQLVNLSLQRSAWLQVWDDQSVRQVIANKRLTGDGGFRDQVLAPEDEAEIERQKAWNKSRFALWLGRIVVQYFFLMCFAMFIAVSAHKAKNLNGYKQAWIAAILAVIPVCTSPLLILGVPFGIWLMLVLKDGSVKRAFIANGG